MSDDYRQNWQGRVVTFRALTVGEAEPIVDLFAEGEGRKGGYLCLALTLQYADTGERVFPGGLDEVRAQPASVQQRIWWLRMRALDLNGFNPEEEPPKVNGADGEAPVPLH